MLHPVEEWFGERSVFEAVDVVEGGDGVEEFRCGDVLSGRPVVPGVGCFDDPLGGFEVVVVAVEGVDEPTGLCDVLGAGNVRRVVGCVDIPTNADRRTR